jgi:hypothetical protein
MLARARNCESEVAMAMVEAIASGVAVDGLRNQFRDLAESVSKGSAVSVDALTSQMTIGGARDGWAKVYAMNEREIRASMKGRLAEIEASMPKRRFKVLASKFAPADTERYFGDLKMESEAVAKRYEALAESGSAIIVAARAASSGYMGPEESLLVSSVHGFIESLIDSAASLSGGFRAIISTAGAGDIPALARTHDLMAEGLLDFTIALSFAERSLPNNIGVSP